MGLPHRRQQLAKFIPFHDLTAKSLAEKLDISESNVRQLVYGRRYPSPDEVRALERIFRMPAEVLLDAELLRYRNGPWPPEGRGFRPGYRS
ncbi:MAG: helix-turn-helix transcriptional regulator [Rhodoglobus sp.]